MGTISLNLDRKRFPTDGAKLMGADLVSQLSQNGSNTRTGSRVNSSDTQVRMGTSILRENGQGSISVYFLYLLLMMPRPYIGCSGF